MDLQKWKARTVAKGFMQEDSGEPTFAPTLKFSTFRMLAALASGYGWRIEQADVNTAFLQARIPDHDEIFVKPPQGFGHPRGHVWRLRRALYGLRSSPRHWNEELHNWLSSNGWHRSPADPCLYSNVDSVYLVVYVDDLLFTGPSCAVAWSIDQVSHRFDIKRLGEVGTFLGVEWKRGSHGRYELTQEAFVQKILRKFNMHDSKGIDSPMDSSTRLSSQMNASARGESSSMKDVPYMSLVGSLLYLTVATRPDVAFVVKELARFGKHPGLQHWRAAKRVLRYLRKYSDIGLHFNSEVCDSSQELVGFVDSSWGDDPDTRRSTSGWVFYFWGFPISWSSKTQHSTALSSTEAEYMCMSDAAREAIYLRTLVKKMVTHPQITLFEDYLGAIYVAGSPVTNTRTKHINIRYHFVREQIEAGTIRVQYVSTKDQLADGLTKPLAPSPFGLWLSRVMNIPGSAMVRAS